MKRRDTLYVRPNGNPFVSCVTRFPRRRRMSLELKLLAGAGALFAIAGLLAGMNQ